MKPALLTFGLLACAGPLGATDTAPDAAQGLDWLQGHWCRVSGESRMEEYWLAPVGGTSVGVNRTVRDGRTVAFEFLRIVLRDGVAVYIASPNGQPPTEFVSTGHGADWIAFENPQHDFPQRIAYRREGSRLLAEISGPGPGGDTTTVPFHFSACR